MVARFAHAEHTMSALEVGLQELEIKVGALEKHKTRRTWPK
jgi:hypothetical protein